MGAARRAYVPCWRSKSRIANEYSSWARWARNFDRSLRLYNSDLTLAAVYCWQRGVFPLARVEAETDGEGRILALECRDTEWALDYELPPLEILRVRLGGLRRVDPTHGVADMRSKSRLTAASSNSTNRVSPPRWRSSICSRGTIPT